MPRARAPPSTPREPPIPTARKPISMRSHSSSGRSGLAAAGARLTLAAQTEDGEVLQVRPKPVSLLDATGQRLQERSVQGGRVAAGPADQVVVPAPLAQLVLDHAGAQVRVGDQAQLLEKLESAVDGRDVDKGVLFPHPLVNGLRRD